MKIHRLSPLALLAASQLMAQSSGGDFEISKSTIDNGGGFSSGNGYSLTGTIGQPDTSNRLSKADGFTMAGGFWADGARLGWIFSDSFESSTRADNSGQPGSGVMSLTQSGQKD